MIINSLKLTNLGPFRGLHEFHLKTNSRKPIVLFGALNGSGKTTIFDSIQLALFGKYIKAAGKFKGKYDNYLKNLINYNTKENEFTSVQLDFTLDEYASKQTITIKREWNYTNKITIGENQNQFRYLPYLPLWWPEIDRESGKAMTQD